MDSEAKSGRMGPFNCSGGQEGSSCQHIVVCRLVQLVLPRPESPCLLATISWNGKVRNATEGDGREETARTHGHEGRPAKDARLHTSFFRGLAFRQRHLKNNDPICLR